MDSQPTLSLPPHPRVCRQEEEALKPVGFEALPCRGIGAPMSPSAAAAHVPGTPSSNLGVAGSMRLLRTPSDLSGWDVVSGDDTSTAATDDSSMGSMDEDSEGSCLEAPPPFGDCCPPLAAEAPQGCVPPPTAAAEATPALLLQEQQQRQALGLQALPQELRELQQLALGLAPQLIRHQPCCPTLYAGRAGPAVAPPPPPAPILAAAPGALPAHEVWEDWLA